MGWIDVHAHLDKLESGPGVALEQARAAGVERVITIGTESSDHEVVLQIAKSFWPEVACTLGVHPHSAKDWSSAIAIKMNQQLAEPEVVAVGEIGLDYYYNSSPKEQQLACFRAQLELAARHQLPVEIHTREAEADTAMVLAEFKGAVQGILHCFTSSQALADKALDLGYNISFSGVLTFKNADSLRETCKAVPLERMHVETDAPFLAPIPQRGKPNTPAWVVFTADKVAELKGVSREQLQRQLFMNAKKMFSRLDWQSSVVASE